MRKEWRWRHGAAAAARGCRPPSTGHFFAPFFVAFHGYFDTILIVKWCRFGDKTGAIFGAKWCCFEYCLAVVLDASC